MENQKRNISSDYIDHIANIFKIEPHELLVERLPVDIRRIDKERDNWELSLTSIVSIYIISHKSNIEYIFRINKRLLNIPP